MTFYYHLNQTTEKNQGVQEDLDRRQWKNPAADVKRHLEDLMVLVAIKYSNRYGLHVPV